VFKRPTAIRGPSPARARPWVYPDEQEAAISAPKTMTSVERNIHIPSCSFLSS